MVHAARSPAVRAHPRASACVALAGLAGLALALALATGPARGQAATLPAAALDRATELARQLAQARAPAQARIVALPGTPDPRLRLAPCTDIRALPSPGAPAWGRTRVQLHCAAGTVAWRISLPLVVQVWAPAWLARAPRAAGETLAADQLVPGVVDWGASATPPLPLEVDASGRTLARPLAAGEALRETDLRARQWFVAGDTVQVTARGSGFAVQAEALALSPGIEGRPVRLKSGNGRVFMAQPVAERRAEVSL